MGSSILAMLSLIVISYSVASVRVIKEGNAALVERLGRYKSTLDPGVRFIVPLLDSLVIEDTLREQVFDIEPRTATTRDNVNVDVDAVIYWRILDLEKTYYAIEDVEIAIRELVTTTLRSEVGKMELQETFSSRDTINKALLDVLDEATEPWGVKVNRVELQEIKIPPEVEESMRREQAAEIAKRAAITEAEGLKQAAILEAEGSVQSMQLISQAFDGQLSQGDIMKFLIAQRYVDANQKLGESDNSKVVFMDPRALTEGLVDLINEPPDTNN
ncbi:MAG: stomatin-like protein [Cyanobacteria bacterium P01_D01_bin.156]